MTNEQMERAIEFLLNSQGQLTADVQGLKEVQAQTSRDVMALAAVVSELTNNVARLEAQAESDRVEIREAIEKLIFASEATRKFSEDIARLEVQTSQRVTEQGKDMDARLNALITIVERHITNADAHKDEG